MTDLAVQKVQAITSVPMVRFCLPMSRSATGEAFYTAAISERLIGRKEEFQELLEGLLPEAIKTWREGCIEAHGADWLPEGEEGWTLVPHPDNDRLVMQSRLLDFAVVLDQAIEFAVAILASAGGVDPKRMKDGLVNGIPFVVPEGTVTIAEPYRDKAVKALSLLQDLDRSTVGRHQGDAEMQDESGTSQGNPYLLEGTRIGTHISGRPIVVPAADKLGDPEAWLGEIPEPGPGTERGPGERKREQR